MTEQSPGGPVLFCFDGSEGSRSALRACGRLIERPAEAVVLTVWETIEVKLALAGGFTAGFSIDGATLDAEEEASARSVAEEGARRATEHGYKAVPMIRQSVDGVAKTILEAADELSARLIVCGQRGRGILRTALLGSVSHTLASHTRHPVLIAPETDAGSH
ncbi:MAG TPA: universal stress protein [Streptosporangiaceae bacterium]|nr:universal stress protein [Streptosporangiaceae bacterium]